MKRFAGSGFAGSGAKRDRTFAASGVRRKRGRPRGRSWVFYGPSGQLVAPPRWQTRRKRGQRQLESKPGWRPSRYNGGARVRLVTLLIWRACRHCGARRTMTRRVALQRSWRSPKTGRWVTRSRYLRRDELRGDRYMTHAPLQVLGSRFSGRCRCPERPRIPHGTRVVLSDGGRVHSFTEKRKARPRLRLGQGE